MKTAAAIVASYVAILLLLLQRLVPADCQADGSIWAVLPAATLPLPVALTLAVAALAVGNRLVKGRWWRWLGFLLWLLLVRYVAVIAVSLGAQWVFDAATAGGFSMDALERCVPRIASDYLNATGGFLFWWYCLAMVACGVVTLLPARMPRSAAP